jgi:hypothetical protein
VTATAAAVLRVRSLYEEVVQWSTRSDNYEFMCVEPRQRLEAFASGVEVPPGVVLTRMQFLAAWYSAKNVAALLESDSAPRDLLRLAHGYGFSECLLARGLFRADARRKRNPRLSRNTLALGVARAAALGLLRDCRSLGQVLLEESETGLFQRDSSMVAPFIARLFSQWQGIEAPSVGGDSSEPEEYGEILRSWSTASSEEMNRLLERACDLHLDRAREHTDDETFEFADPVYAIYPVEILMVLQLRKERGLSIPAVDHPLMTWPMGSLVAEVRSTPNDELLRRVGERVEVLCSV